MPHQTVKSKEKKSAVVSKFKTTAADTGSPEVQVALITKRISELTEHLRSHKKDFSSQRGLMKLVGQRRRLLTFLRNQDESRYSKLISGLELRK